MGLRDMFRNLDEFLDGKVSKIPDVAPKRRTESMDEYEARIRGTFRKVGLKTKTTMRSLDEYGDKATAKMRKGRGKGIDSLLNVTLNKPLVTIILVVAICGGIATQSIYILDNMRGDMEIYLPPGDPSTEVMNEVREDWSIDVIVILVESKDNDGDGHKDNITNREILMEMSYVEGETTNENNEFPYNGLDWDRKDHGLNDGFSYALSISAIIKAINETAGNTAEAVQEEFGLLPGIVQDVPGTYAMPDQNTIDNIVSRVKPDDVEAMLKDTDGDSVFDMAVIMLGVNSKTPPATIIERVDTVIDARAEGLGKNVTACTMINTGPFTVIEKMQGRTVTEFTKVIPTMLGVLALVLFFFHRSVKVVFIALVPVGLALGMTLGITGLLSEVSPDYFLISPQIALIVPVLIALGVAYGLYISNRYGEEVSGSPQAKMKRAVKAQHAAILLSAGTTALGFGSLMVGTLPPIVTVGFALALGIGLTYALTMILTPPLVMLLKYEKKAKYKAFKAISTIPSLNRKKILVGVMIIVLVSVVLIPSVRFDADFLAMMPADDPSIQAMNRYSKIMGGGQLGMIIVRADAVDYGTLDYVEKLEGDINDVENSEALSIVTIMKMVKSPDNITLPRIGQVSLPANTSYWDLISNPTFEPFQDSLIRIFYGSLSKELREMFINEDRDKMLVYVFMPYMDIGKTETAVNAVNTVIHNKGSPPAGTSSTLTGVASLQLAVNSLIIQSQFQTLALTIFLSIVILTIVFRSWKLGILTMIPCCIVVGLQPLIMVGLDIPLSLITVMIGSIAIGTGVDFSIQISQRMNLTGMTIPNLYDTVENMGTSFIEATATMVLGFSAVLFAPWPGRGPYDLPVTFGIAITSVQEFIEMIMILLTLNAIAALFVLPAILTIWFRARKAEEQRQKNLRRMEAESIRRARAGVMTDEEMEVMERELFEEEEYADGDEYKDEKGPPPEDDDGALEEEVYEDYDDEEYTDGDEEGEAVDERPVRRGPVSRPGGRGRGRGRRR